MKYLIEVDLIKGDGTCAECVFFTSNDCPCEDCGMNNIFELMDIEEVEETDE